MPLQGEHFLRRPLRQVRAEGPEIEQRERFKLGIIERLAARSPRPDSVISAGTKDGRPRR